MELKQESIVNYLSALNKTHNQNQIVFQNIKETNQKQNHLNSWLNPKYHSAKIWLNWAIFGIWEEISSTQEWKIQTLSKWKREN